MDSSFNDIVVDLLLGGGGESCIKMTSFSSFSSFFSFLFFLGELLV